MWRTKFNIPDIQRDLHSETLSVRQTAMQKLMARVKEDPRIRPDALSIFDAMLDSEQDPWTIVQAALGIETIAGPTAGRIVWLRLLHHPQAQIVAHAALSTTDPTYGPVLMEILKQRSEIPIRRCVLNALGRTQVSMAFPVLVEHLALPQFRSDAIYALEFLGDARAIPYLKPFEHDMAELAERDERGAVLTVSDIARAAIRRLQR